MQEQGIVIESGGGTARIRIHRAERCDQCAGCLASGDGLAMIATAVDRIGVSPGDLVRIETRGVSPLKAALLLFLLPLGSTFAGYGAGVLAASSLGFGTRAEIAGATGAIMFFLASFAAISAARRFRGSRPGTPRLSSLIVERLGPESQGISRHDTADHDEGRFPD